MSSKPIFSPLRVSICELAPPIRLSARSLRALIDFVCDKCTYYYYFWFNHHRHLRQLNIHFLPRIIKGMDSCFPTARGSSDTSILRQSAYQSPSSSCLSKGKLERVFGSNCSKLSELNRSKLSGSNCSKLSGSDSSKLSRRGLFLNIYLRAEKQTQGTLKETLAEQDWIEYDCILESFGFWQHLKSLKSWSCLKSKVCILLTVIQLDNSIVRLS